MADADQKEKPAAAEAVPTYEAERLIDEAHDFFGEAPHVVAGALHGTHKKNFTLDEVKGLIKAFKRRPVESDNDSREA